MFCLKSPALQGLKYAVVQVKGLCKEINQIGVVRDGDNVNQDGAAERNDHECLGRIGLIAFANCRHICHTVWSSA